MGRLGVIFAFRPSPVLRDRRPTTDIPCAVRPALSLVIGTRA